MQSTSGKIQHRELSILVGLLGGILLTIFAASSPLSDFGSVDLVIFLAIPSLSGALVGFSDPENSVSNGALVGVLIGLAYDVIESVKLNGTAPTNIVLLLALTVPIWGFFGGAGSMFVHRALASSKAAKPAVKICSSCKTTNPPDALFCKNCGTKLS